jgi:chemotaxis methyl-accepting protein methylase
MNKKELYNKGYNTGYDIAESNRADYNLMDENEREKFISDMSEHESDIYRQYTPFEFLAHEINSSKYPDELWEAYDTGVYDGIMQLVKDGKRRSKFD